MPKRLIDLVEAGRIADEAGLKRAYRSLAKRIHPDLADAGAIASAGRNSGAAFIALKADYEAALSLLARGPAPSVGPAERAVAKKRDAVVPLPYSRGSFYIVLSELLARGFPRLPERPWPKVPRQAYEVARETFRGLLAGRDQVEPSRRCLDAFMAFETGYLALAGADPQGLSKEVRLSNAIRNLVLDIVGYHGLETPQALRYAAAEWPRIQAELRERSEERPLAFLELLVSDMAEGSARIDG